MTSVAMHAETTTDPTTMRWVVRGALVSGQAVFNSGHLADSLPPRWNDALAAGEVDQVIVADGELRVQIARQGQWHDLAPELQDSLAQHLNSGQLIHAVTAARSDAELTDAVQALLTGPLASYVAGHGGEIKLESVVNAVVTVRLIGACKGCSSAGETLKQGIADQLRENYPEIKEIRSIDDKGSTVTGLTESGRRLLPFAK